jgi:hypothetical protein
MAVIKSGTVLMPPFLASYSYVIGMDGFLFPSWSGNKDIAPGKHRFAFGGSHGAGLKSVLETNLTIKQGCQYVMESWEFIEPHATYVVYEYPGKKEIMRTTAPLITTAEHGAGDTIKSMLVAKGWKVSQ